MSRFSGSSAIACFLLSIAVVTAQSAPPVKPSPQAGRGSVPAAGEWEGVTAQGKTVSFVVSNGRITSFTAAGSIEGAGCSSETSTTATTSRPITNSGFAISAPGGPGGASLSASGRFLTPRSACGGVSLTLQPAVGPPPGVPGHIPSCRGLLNTTWVAAPAGSPPPAPSKDCPTAAAPAPRSNGWQWVYETGAAGQSFRAAGATITRLLVRVAKLNENTPEAPLHVEIRDPTFADVYVHGTIPPARARLEFQWIPATLDHVASLTPKESYVLLFHSQATTHRAPWAVNAIYSDVYPDGSKLDAEKHDILFEMAFGARSVLRAGPTGLKPELPVNSGVDGGRSSRTQLTVASRPIPEGRYVPKGGRQGG